jgi:hypothetical protein
MLFLVKNSLFRKKCETVSCHAATANYFVAKVRGEVFAQFHAVAVKRQISMRNRLFVLQGRILYDQSLEDEHGFDFSLHMSHLIWSRRV